MKLPTSLGGMGIRAVTSQLEISFDIAAKKTRKQAERNEKNLTGNMKVKEKDTKCGTERKTLDTKTGERQMTGPFKWDLVNASKGHGFSSSISRTLKTHEIITAHKL